MPKIMEIIEKKRKAKALIPNSQRAYFNENETRVLFEDLLREYFYDILHKLYYEANKVKNDYKRQEEYISKVSEYQKKEKNVKSYNLTFLKQEKCGRDF